jgi:hypothetical protein
VWLLSWVPAWLADKRSRQEASLEQQWAAASLLSAAMLCAMLW